MITNSLHILTGFFKMHMPETIMGFPALFFIIKWSLLLNSMAQYQLLILGQKIYWKIAALVGIPVLFTILSCHKVTLLCMELLLYVFTIGCIIWYIKSIIKKPPTAFSLIAAYMALGLTIPLFVGIREIVALCFKVKSSLVMMPSLVDTICCYIIIKTLIFKKNTQDAWSFLWAIFPFMSTLHLLGLLFNLLLDVIKKMPA